MASYELFNASAGVPGLTSCTIEISDELGTLSIGDTVDFTAYVKTVAGFPGDVSLVFGLRAVAYMSTFYATRYRNSSYDVMRLSKDGYFSAYESIAHSIASFTGQMITMTGTINVTQHVLAGLLEASEDLELGVFVRYSRSSSDSVNATSRSVATGLSVSSSGYTMPNLSAMVYVDTGSGNPLGVFGDYVQGKSVPRLTIRMANIGLDARFTGAPFRCRFNAHFPNGTGDEDKSIYLSSSADTYTRNLGARAATAAGVVTWTLYIEDDSGFCGVTTGSFDVLPYAAPALTFGLTRYAQVLDDNDEPAYEETDDGENVWADLTIDVAQLNSLNAWTLTVDWTPNDTGASLPITLLSASDGGSWHRNQDVTLITSLFSAANDYTFTATLTDRFGNSVVTTYIYKAGGYANLEKFGFRIGGRTTGTAQAPKFESDYPAYMYAGIQGVNNYETAEVQTGGHWIDGKPIYRFVATGTVTLAASTTLLTLPSVPDNVIDIRMAVYAGSDWKPVCYTYYSNDNWDTNVRIDNNGDVIVQAGSSARISTKYNLIIEYTKTTD